MAGRPVPVSGGSSGLLYGMITFAILTVACLGLFIFQLTKNKAAEDRVQSAERQAERYGRPPAYYQDEATARHSTVFAVMAGDISDVAMLVTGASEDVGATMLNKSRRVLGGLANRHDGIGETATLLQALRTLDESYVSELRRADSLAADLEVVTSEKVALTGQLKSTRDEFEAQVAALGEQLKQSQEEKLDALAQKDGQLQELQGSLDSAEQQLQTSRRENSNSVRDLEIELGQAHSMVEELQKKIQEIKPDSFDPNAILTSADGRILRAIPGSDVVYVNLGVTDKIKPGMGFEVYSQAALAPSGLRGKASIEVVTVMDDTAECRVTRRESGKPIMEGDIIVNVAFERNRRPKFVVRGDFDLDFDGLVDPTGVEQIITIIRQWGGQIADDLDESVDFVIVGLPPGGASFDIDESASALVRDQAVRREFERSRFRLLIDRAQKMYIPVITQNQFLFLSGYAGDGSAVR